MEEGMYGKGGERKESGKNILLQLPASMLF